MNPLNKILLGLGAGVALIIAAVIVWLSLANAHLQAALAEAHANNTACQMANDEFRLKAQQQNKAIEALKAEADERTARAAKAVREAQKTAAFYQADAARLARQKASGEDCQAAAALFDRYNAEAQ